jgi:Leucine-rich repeat (LRR) protein
MGNISATTTDEAKSAVEQQVLSQQQERQLDAVIHRIIKFHSLNITPTMNAVQLNDEFVTIIEKHLNTLQNQEQLTSEEQKELDFYIKEVSVVKVLYPVFPFKYLLKLSQLNVLKLSDISFAFCNLRDMVPPDTMDFQFDKVFPSLERLSLFANHFEKLPDSLGQCSNLQFIDLRSNPCIDSDQFIPFLSDPEKCSIKNLKTLKLAACHNYVRKAGQVTVPGTLLSLHPNLVNIDLAQNMIKSFCMDLTSPGVVLSGLTEIVLMSNKLTELNPIVFCGTTLPALKTLALTQNKLTSLPEEFCTITTLERLYISLNAITSLPDSFGQLINLKHFECQGNKLTTLPDSFENIVDLVVLDLTDNEMNKVNDNIIIALQKLETLLLGGNKLSNETFSLSLLGKYVTRLYTLNLGYNQFTSVDELFEHENVEQEELCLYRISLLVLSGNKLTSLPMQIATRPSIQKLFAGNNKINSLPDGFLSKLDSVRSLSLFGNKLTDEVIPENYFNMHTNVKFQNQITALDLSHNDFEFENMDLKSFESDIKQLKGNYQIEFQTQFNGSIKEKESHIHNNESDNNGSVSSGTAHMIGARPTMEDSYIINNNIETGSSKVHVQLYAVFDGHAGSETSTSVAENLPTIVSKLVKASKLKLDPTSTSDFHEVGKEVLDSALQQMDDKIKQQGFTDGCTAIVVLIINYSICIAANIGDSRIVSIQESEEQDSKSIIGHRVSIDHKPRSKSERRRIRSVGGCVHENRVNGVCI